VTPEGFLRGRAWAGGADAAYPRADPADAARLPADTWAAARIPAGVRLELTGSAPAVRIEYRTDTDDLGYRGAGAGTAFESWWGGRRIDEAPASLGSGTAELRLGGGAERTVVYLPEGMRPTILGLEPVDGDLVPAPAQPRWVAYGDSIVEGWVASAPARAWPAVAGRRFGLDVVNLGYAGSARGEMVTAEQLCGLAADVISIGHGTNCWTRIPHSAAMMRAGTGAFMEVVRQGHPDTPIVVTSPVLRPDAEQTPNRLGATLADLRTAVEDAVRERMARGDRRLHLVRGGGLLRADQLPDGIHPGDQGHEVLAAAFGAAVAAAMDG